MCGYIVRASCIVDLCCWCIRAMHPTTLYMAGHNGPSQIPNLNNISLQSLHHQVFLARSKTDPTKQFALKRIRMENEKEGFPITAIREIKLLAFLGAQPNPQNVIKLHDVVRSKGARLILVGHSNACAYSHVFTMHSLIYSHVHLPQRPSKTSSSQQYTWCLNTWIMT